MKFILSGSVLIVSLCLFCCLQQISASTEPVCSYVNAEGERKFLKYLPLTKKGEEYVDFDSTGKCVKRVECNEQFKLIEESCKGYGVTCDNKNKYKGVFPACCVKC